MAKIQKKSKQQFHLIPFFYFPPKDCPSGGGQLSPLGFAACQSKNCTNRANNILPQIFAEVFRGCSSPCCTNKANVHQHYNPPTDCKKLLAQDILPQIAKNFWRKIFSHRLHRCAQIRRVWHPCHTHAATKLSSHRIHGTHRNDWRRRKICVHL